MIRCSCCENERTFFYWMKFKETELGQEPIRWGLHLHLFLESTFSRVDLLIERFPEKVSRADRGKSQQK